MVVRSASCSGDSPGALRNGSCSGDSPGARRRCSISDASPGSRRRCSVSGGSPDARRPPPQSTGRSDSPGSLRPQAAASSSNDEWRDGFNGVTANGSHAARSTNGDTNQRLTQSRVESSRVRSSQVKSSQVKSRHASEAHTMHAFTYVHAFNALIDEQGLTPGMHFTCILLCACIQYTVSLRRRRALCVVQAATWPAHQP